jgi:hypothetical protein
MVIYVISHNFSQKSIFQGMARNRPGLNPSLRSSPSVLHPTPSYIQVRIEYNFARRQVLTGSIRSPLLTLRTPLVAESLGGEFRRFLCSSFPSPPAMLAVAIPTAKSTPRTTKRARCAPKAFRTPVPADADLMPKKDLPPGYTSVCLLLSLRPSA